MATQMPWKEYGRYGSVGIELIASIAIGYYGGRALDRYFHTNGWLTGIGFIIGVYAGFRALFLTAKKMQRDAERAEAKMNEPSNEETTPKDDHDR